LRRAGVPRLQLGGGQPGQRLQVFFLLGAQAARRLVHDRQHAQQRAVLAAQRQAAVKTGLGRNARRQQRLARRRFERGPAQRDQPLALLRGKAGAGDEHGFVVFKGSNDGNRHATGAGCQPGQPVGAGMRQHMEREGGGRYGGNGDGHGQAPAFQNIQLTMLTHRAAIFS
jgi:hypothetical protein